MANKSKSKKERKLCIYLALRSSFAVLPDLFQEQTQETNELIK